MAKTLKTPKKNENLAVVLSLCAFVFAANFLTMPRISYSGDPVAMRIGALSLLDGHQFEIADTVASQSTRGQFFVQNSRNGKYYSKYGIFNSLMYVPPLWGGKLFFGESASAPGGGDPKTFSLNLYNLFLNLIVTIYLFLIVSLFSDRKWVRVSYVLAALYTTFLWNFMRAQTAELFQIVFFLGLFYHLLAYERAFDSDPKKFAIPKRQLLFSMLYLLFLCLSKFSDVLLIPPTVAWFLCASYRPPKKGKDLGIIAEAVGNFKKYFKEFALFSFLPAIAIVVLLLYLNYYQFGSPLDTGYNQWARYADSFAGDIFEGLYGFTFLANRSLFVHFPILLFSIFGMKKFYSKHRLTSLWIGSVFVVFLLTISKLPFWAGEACYGPRLLLFLLPVVSLPFVETLHSVQDHWNKGLYKVSAVIMGLLLLFSFQLQMNVNALHFFVYYTMESAVIGAADQLNRNILDERFFKGRNYGVINGELLSYKKSGDYAAFDYAKSVLSPERFMEMKSKADPLLISNYYWFP